MSTAGEVRAALNTSMTGSQKNTNVATVRRGPVRPATGSGSSGGVGPVRSTRPRTNISADTDIKTKYGTVVKGFKLLETTCEELKSKLVDSEGQVRSSEQAYAALMEKARTDEAAHLKLVSKLEDKVRSYDAAYTSLVSQAQEQARSNEAALRDLISRAEERIRLDGVAHTALVSEMEERIQADAAAYFELSEKMKECESALKDRESDLNALRNTIQESVTCGVCQSIPTQPCSTECRHVFCAMCLLSWWQTKRETTCPTCRTVARFPPVRDPVQGFVCLARAQAGEEEDSEPFDADIFDSFFTLKTRTGLGLREVIDIS